jgi:hypothetical protein
MTIHYGEGRLYIADWGYPLTRVLDLTTWQWRPPLALGTDVYKINAGRPGRIYTEGFDQWVPSAIIDTATGLAVGQISWSLREGDAEISPDGTRYYHADNNISNASLHLFDISTDEGATRPMRFYRLESE